MKHIYYICNLQAGKAELAAHLGLVVDTMTKAGYEVTIHPTQAPLDATKMAAEASDSGKYDYLFCSGGDGTLNETLTGLMQAKHRIPLGYIPCGSVNDFARSIGKDVEIRFYRQIDGVKELTGSLSSYSADTVTVRLEDGSEKVLNRSDIARIRLAFYF